MKGPRIPPAKRAPAKPSKKKAAPKKRRVRKSY